MKIPKKINLANIPTPLNKIEFEGCKFYIKRDDLTGIELTGNKVRKLEYLLYDAKKKKANYVFTSGGEQSNHARATAIAATALGFKTKLFLWGNENRTPDGNLFLDKLTGAEIKFLNKNEYSNVNSLMKEEKEKLKSEGLKSYVIPSGGSSPLGIWGYINFVKELSKQINLKKIKGIVCANGSSGTTTGLLIGSKLLNLKLKIFSVNVFSPPDIVMQEVEELMTECIKDYKLDIKSSYKNLEILDGYSTEGYKSFSEDKIELVKKFFKNTGILLDPAYTGKAFKAYYDNFIVGNKKSDVIFLHTGGIFGTFPKRKNYLV